jgi:hypothetical protein
VYLEGKGRQARTWWHGGRNWWGKGITVSNRVRVGDRGRAKRCESNPMSAIWAERDRCHDIAGHACKCVEESDE